MNKRRATGKDTIFFVDEDVRSGALLSALDAECIPYATLPRGTPDTEWMWAGHQNGWAVLTRDGKIKTRPLEMMALQATQLKVFCLSGGNMRSELEAQIILKAIPAMRRFVVRYEGPFMATIRKDSKVLMRRNIWLEMQDPPPYPA